jgi:RHS repeat-associated protein
VYQNAIILRDRDTDSDGAMDERLWAVQDANWNVVALVDGSQAVDERYMYDPFGSTTVYDGSFTIRSGGTNYAWIYDFQGMRFDLVSGQILAQQRSVDTVLGVWTTIDPSRFAAHDMNFYRFIFIGNRPENSVDPTGLDAVSVSGDTDSSNYTDSSNSTASTNRC